MPHGVVRGGNLNQPSNGGLLLGLQYLRFFAALLVVLGHAWQMVPIVGVGDLGSGFKGGASGVDMFFAISGFIMVHITADRPVSPGQFFTDRVARISPSYWVITLLMAAILIVAPSVFRSASFDMASLITSLFFIPWPSNAVPGATPLLQIGWTLNYEMLFYAIFALGMLVSRDWRVPIAAIVITLLVSMQLVWDNRTNDFFQFYSSTIMLEFVFGMMIALVFRRYRPGNAVLAVLAVLAVAAFAWALTNSMWRLDQMRFLVWGVPAALVVASVTAADLRGIVPHVKILLLLGNASYAIYLTHLFPLGALRKVWPMMPQVLQSSDVFLLGAAVAISLIVGVGFYLLVEKPLVRLAKAGVKRLRQRPLHSAANLAGHG